MPTDMLKL